MKLIRIGLHSLMLVVANAAGILAGFFAYMTFNSDQLMIQLPAATASSILIFLLWYLTLPVWDGQRFRLLEMKEWLLVFVCSAAWAPVIFASLYFFTPGYHAVLENLVVLALYQIPVNLIALCIVWIIQN